MSTKIFTAYRLKRSRDLWPLLHDIRLKATANLQKVLTDRLNALAELVDPACEPYLKAVATHKSAGVREDRLDRRARLELAETILTRNYREQVTDHQRSVWNFDVSVGIRQWKGTLYLIPYCDMFVRSVLDFLKRDPRLEDFHYQNCTDRPKNVPAQQWAKRQYVWDAIDRSGQWEDVLCLDICQWGMWWKVNPHFDMLLKESRQEKAKPAARPGVKPKVKPKPKPKRAAKTKPQ